MKILFVGHFSSPSNEEDLASSNAGNFVQNKIISELNAEKENVVKALALNTVTAWPLGRFIQSREETYQTRFPAFINVKVVKELCFSTTLFWEALNKRPDLIVQYNSYLFTNIAIISFTKIWRKKSAIIIQDFRARGNFKISARIHDRVAGLLVPFFDYAIPVSWQLADRLRIKAARRFIFPGSMEEIAFAGDDHTTSDSYTITKKPYAVFAGALEPHNGIDKVIEKWPIEAGCELHIFGNGSLANQVRNEVEKRRNIRFHGPVPKSVVAQYMRYSAFNICLRYDSGLEQNWFFPSKFFDVNSKPGFAIVNRFNNLPPEYEEIGGLVDDGLTNLAEILKSDCEMQKRITQERQAILSATYQWRHVFDAILKAI